MVLSNESGRVYRGKGYKAVDRLDCFVVVWDVDGVYPGPNYGCTQHPFLLALRLILIVNRAAQDVVYDGPRFRRELCIGRYSFNRRGGLSSTDCLPDISHKVAGPDKLFHHKFQVSTSVGLVLVVSVVITPQRLIVMCGI